MNTKTTHSAGPWTASEGCPTDVWHVDMPERAFVITVSRADSDADMTTEEVAANARLLAAAPELLAALQDALRVLVTVGGFPEKSKGRTDKQQAAFDAARNAIHKATGS